LVKISEDNLSLCAFAYIIGSPIYFHPYISQKIICEVRFPDTKVNPSGEMAKNICLKSSSVLIGSPIIFPVSISQSAIFEIPAEIILLQSVVNLIDVTS
jgi:hypothetical protein